MMTRSKVYEKMVSSFHTIELMTDAEPFRQEQTPVNPEIEAAMKQELLFLLDAKIYIRSSIQLG